MGGINPTRQSSCFSPPNTTPVITFFINPEMHGFFILALAACIASAVAAPLFAIRDSEDSPQEPIPLSNNVLLEPSFRREPEGRGTASLLWSCTITFVLCVWTTIHPNILPNSGGKGQLRFKFVWMMVAVILPEYVVLCALGELRKANEVCKVWEKKHGKGTLGVAGGFFVLMGGFTATDTEGNIFTLTTNGFIKYTNSNQISRDMVDLLAIKDKEKASEFTKLITLIQAVWFVFQYIARWYQRLPVTLLERHVGVQVVFTLCTCYCWWNKPLDVVCPIHIELTVRPPPTDETEITVTARSVGPSPTDENVLLAPPDKISANSSPEDEVVENPERETTAAPLCESTWYAKDRNFIYEKRRLDIIHLVLKCDYDLFQYVTTGEPVSVLLGAILLTGSGLWHLFPWNSHFPTPVERLMWIGSCIIICSSSLLLPLAMFKDSQEFFTAGVWEARFIDSDVWASYAAMRNRIASYHGGKIWSSRLLLPFMGVVNAVLIFCSLFVTVESFISVRSLVEGSYSSPPLDIAKYFPSFA